MNCEALKLDLAGWSNPLLPVLLYRKALATGSADDLAERFEAMFDRNGWPAQWRNGVYKFHHFHSNAHEALGVAAGSARLRLGGPEGKDITLAAGDAVLLPAGTGHIQMQADADFLVVGAYPPDQQQFDLCRAPASRETSVLLAALGFPATDPVGGAGGALCRLWQAPPKG